MKTITVDHTLESTATLGVIVLFRTILSISLTIELDGVVPWRKTPAITPAAPPSD